MVLYVLYLIDCEKVSLQERVDNKSLLFSYLRLLMDPPQEESLEKAVMKLKRINAVVEGNDHEYHVTVLGRRLLELPLPPESGFMVLVGVTCESEG